MGTDAAHGRIVPAVFFLSAAAMADEIFLIRLLSVRFWPHFVPLVIAQAMLGFGASGVALHLLRPRIAKEPEKVFAWAVLLAAPSYEIAFRFSQHVPFDPFLLLWHPSSWTSFALFFFLLAIPFFLAGTAVGVPLSFGLGRVGAVYAASFAGTAAGAVLSLAAFSLVPTESLLRVSLVLGLFASAFVLAHPGGRLQAGRLLTGGLSLLLLLIPPVVLSLSPYKDLAIARKLPEARTLSVRYGISGDFRAVYSPGIHNAPGLSFRFEGEIPPQAALFADGELRGIVPRGGGKSPPSYLGFLPAALPYRMAGRPAVAQFGLRGTEGILMAAKHGASSVTVVEPAAELARMIEDDLAEFGGGTPAAIRVEVREEGGRNFLARSREKFDIIELADVSSLAFSSLGIHATGETYLLTREGIRSTLSKLTDGGMLAVSGWLKSPPRESVKVLNTIRVELDREGLPAPGRFVVVRGWGSFVVVARKIPFSPDELAAAGRFCRETGFTVVWPEREPPTGGTSGEEAGFRNAVRSALEGPTSGGDAASLFDLRPVTDDSPYFHRFLNLRSLPEFRRILGDQWVPFVEWGVVFLVLSLAVSVALAAVFLLLPLPFTPEGGSGGGLPVAAYFSALGLGYMLIELTFLKIGILLLGDPIRAAAAAVGGFPLLSGIGSAVSGKLESSKTMRRWVFPGIAILAMAGFLALFHGTPCLLEKGAGWRFFAFLATLAPAAFLMGMPFPLALSRMARAGSPAIPYAWGVNGFFSVAGASVASIGALWIGFHATVAAGAVLYLLAGIVFRRLATGGFPVR
ncbi:MAG TPA: hypothetical protein VJ307_10775 [Candidatus Deferrimicrobiaceae bacterium]|nr:hypothetical protein [Candidatus Deferrimicrobiaceae bacterium]